MSESVESAPGITVDKGVRFGKPVVKGTRVDVATVLYQLAAGAGYEEIEREDGVSREGILAILGFAAEIVSHEVVRAT